MSAFTLIVHLDLCMHSFTHVFPNEFYMCGKTCAQIIFIPQPGCGRKMPETVCVVGGGACV